MEEEILAKIEAQDKKLEEIYRSVEKTRKYFLLILIISVALIIIPLIGLIFVIPQFLNIYNSANLGL